ncbi:MAG: aldehyde dehydrogenase family protein [Candidatus Marinimicrobia bacterium]|nr:aldehyde dehydrogenase family protein [Candidatus Neomarinimicrobiota bacterium]
MSFSVRNPRTGQVDYSFDSPTQGELSSICLSLRNNQKYWAEKGIDYRIGVMQAWKNAYVENQAELIDALATDTGRIYETTLEVETIPKSIDRWCDIAKELFGNSKPKPSSIPFISMEQHTIPYALVGIISPWNVPNLLAHIDAIPALLAGSSVIIKPSEFTPRFIDPLQKSVESIQEMSGILHYVQGAAETGATLVDEVDLICFTGSVPTGKKVGEQAAKNFIPAFLELGGKDAAVVLESANLDNAASAILWGSVVNAGQSCLSIERVYVMDSVYESFISLLTEKAKKLKLAYPEMDSGEIGPIISPNQATLIEGHLNDAKSKGAVVHCGGELEHQGGGDWVFPTVLSNVNHDMKVMTEETFGPVIPIMSVSSSDEAIRCANDTEFGLSGAVFGDESKARSIAEKMEAGAISINDAGLTSILYDGEKNSFKSSGLGGSRMGQASIQRFLRKKVLYTKTNTDNDPWWYK